jgi:hydrogenase-4 component F
MELAGILIVPLLASGLSSLPLGRRFAAPITLFASMVVLGLAVAVALEAARTGHVAASGEWLTCDGLGALVLLLVAFVGFTAALFSWGYIGERVKRGSQKNLRLYYALYNLFVLSMLAVPLLANVALMWIAVELTTLLSAFLVGFEDTPEALEAAWKYVVLTTLGAVLALLGFLILYWGSRVAGLEPFTWLGLVDVAPRSRRRCCGQLFCSSWSASVPRSGLFRCIPGYLTPIVRHRHQSAHCFPASKRQPCSTSSFGYSR